MGNPEFLAPGFDGAQGLVVVESVCVSLPLYPFDFFQMSRSNFKKIMSDFMYKHRKMSAEISNEVTLNLEIDLGTVDIFMVLHLFICDLCLFFLLKLAFSPNNLHENLVCCL